MGRPIKDYWNWAQIRIPYHNWEASKHSEIDRYLYNQSGGSTSGYQVWTEREWPAVRTRHTYKKTTAYVYCIKNSVDATYIAMKYANGLG
jgi:hypothetical protein